MESTFMWHHVWEAVEHGHGRSIDTYDLYSPESQGKQQLFLVLEHLCICKRFICQQLMAH